MVVLPHGSLARNFAASGVEQAYKLATGPELDPDKRNVSVDLSMGYRAPAVSACLLESLVSRCNA